VTLDFRSHREEPKLLYSRRKSLAERELVVRERSEILQPRDELQGSCVVGKEDAAAKVIITADNLHFFIL